MNRKVAKLLAATTALAGTGLATAQDTTTNLFGFSLSSILTDLGFSVTDISGVILPVAGVILFLLFARFGGFRWLY